MLKLQGILPLHNFLAQPLVSAFANRVRKRTLNAEYAKGRAPGSMSDSTAQSARSQPPDRPPALTRKDVRALALGAEFSEAGLVALPHAHEARDAARFEEWVRAGRAGTMHYLERTGEDGQKVRARIAIPLPWARSAIVCLANYHPAQPLSTAPALPGAGWIARYAWSSGVNAEGIRRPSDYHKVLLKRLKLLQARLHGQFGDFESRAYVDTGPVVERSLATAAGLGWTAKNTCLIHPKLGSFAFLAVLLT
jgi:epoxyqueuosine reductase